MTVGMKWHCPSDKIEDVRRVIENAFRPAPEEDLNRALYQMRRMTVGRDGEFQDEASGAAEIATWMAYLREYPGDVAVSVIQDWPKVCKFRPAWFEIQERLEQAMSQRRVMLHAITQIAAQGPSEGLRLNANPQTDEERAATVDKILKDLAKNTAMGPFRANKTPEQLKRGRLAEATDDYQDALRAEADLENYERDIPTFRLSEAALKAFGVSAKKDEEGS